METTLATLGLAGSIALLLWGTHMVQTGVQRAFGPRLSAFLSHTLRHRLAAFAAGIGITLAVQSSTATALMATNFAAGGLVGFIPAMAIVLGANVGTALIVTILSFNASIISAPLILLGVVLFRSDSNPTSHDLGRVFIGLGLMLLALHQMLAALKPMAATPDVVTILSVLYSMPIVAIMLGALAAWAVHSSVAVVLLIASLAGQGIVSVEPALMLVLGANLGTAVNPLLEATGGKEGMTRRLPVANLANRFFGIVVAWLLMPVILYSIDRLALAPAATVATFHLIFNLVLAALMLPLLAPISRVVERLMPERPNAADPAAPRYLDPAAREVPAVALAGAAREALRLADALEAMLSDARTALISSSRRRISEAKAMDDVLDSINTAIRHYLAGLEADALSEAENRRLHQILVFATNIEQAGDVIEGNLLPHANKRLKRGLLPSPEHESELLALMDRLIQNTRMAASLFVDGDPRLARELAAQKLHFRHVEREATTNHFTRMRDGISAASQSAGLQVDLMRDMKLINSHIVAAAAYPILERSGELLPMRLAQSSRLE